MRKRIMAFMNISEADYNFIFTANQSAAFKLVAESYPFQYSRNLVTVYDHQSEAVEVMIERSKNRGAKAISASFSWPNLEIQTDKLRKKISKLKKKSLSNTRTMKMKPVMKYRNLKEKEPKQRKRLYHFLKLKK
ncbi:hypothetical protein GOBAR_DD31066 [Gossypium barbadense]|nr:hypothetical protein GOBAR_DD31066 [Gossypium barbadense]